MDTKSNEAVDDIFHNHLHSDTLSNAAIKYNSLQRKQEIDLEKSLNINADNYQAKQNELSSWYYIKSKPKVMSIYNETKEKKNSFGNNFSTSPLQKFRSIDDLIQRQHNRTVIQNDILKYNSREYIYQVKAEPSYDPDIDCNSEEYIKSLRIAATKLKSQQSNVSENFLYHPHGYYAFKLRLNAYD